MGDVEKESAVYICMSEPANKKLYEEIKKDIYSQYPKHSAYRSGLLVKAYKEAGGTYKGKKKENEGLSRWFKEKWTSQRGTTGYKHKSDVYRPTVRVTKDTPTTFKELTPAQIEKARKEKARTGKVKRFDK